MALFLPRCRSCHGCQCSVGFYIHEVLQKLLASYRLQGVPDDLTQFFLLRCRSCTGCQCSVGFYIHEVLQKLLASFRLQGVPDDLTQLQHPWFTRWWRLSCHVAGLVMDVSAVWAFIYTRSCKSCLQATVCKGFPMTLHSCSIP